MRQWRTALAVITTVVLASAACGPTQTGGGGSTTPVEEQPVHGGRVIEGRASDAQRLNPAVSNDDGSSLINSKIYDTLVNTNPKTGEPIPWMGKWTVTADNLTYTWTIDPKANWSDGKPVIAQDWVTRVKPQGRSTITPNTSTSNEMEGYPATSSPQPTTT